MSAPRCIRCYFSGGKTATDEVRVTYGKAEYALDLCAKHAKEVDDMLWGWLRGAREVSTQTAFPELITMTDHLRKNETRVQEPPKNVTEPVTPIKVAKTDMDIIRLRWTLTEHAMERFEERSKLFNFSMDDVLLAAERPDRAHRSRTDDGVWVHWRRNLKILVNREERVIITVGGLHADGRMPAYG